MCVLLQTGARSAAGIRLWNSKWADEWRQTETSHACEPFSLVSIEHQYSLNPEENGSQNEGDQKKTKNKKKSPWDAKYSRQKTLTASREEVSWCLLGDGRKRKWKGAELQEQRARKIWCNWMIFWGSKGFQRKKRMGKWKDRKWIDSKMRSGREVERWYAKREIWEPDDPDVAKTSSGGVYRTDTLFFFSLLQSQISVWLWC